MTDRGLEYLDAEREEISHAWTRMLVQLECGADPAARTRWVTYLTDALKRRSDVAPHGEHYERGEA